MRSQADLRDEMYMRQAIELARLVPMVPFGAVIVHESGDIIGQGWNRSSEDPTAHGEMEAIRAAARHPAADWPRCTLYTTAEPCPMCAAAIFWAGIGRVCYGTSITSLIRFGWKQIDIPMSEVVTRSTFGQCALVPAVCEAECDDLFHHAATLRS